MNYIYNKSVKIVHFVVIILCNFIGTGFSTSLFGFDFLPSDKDLDTGFEKISPPVFKQTKNRKAYDSFGSFDPFSSKDNIVKPNLFTTTPPASIDSVDKSKPQPAYKQNKNKQKANNPFGSIDPFSSNDNIFKPKLFTPTPPAPIDLADNFKIPELPLEFVNKLTNDKKKSGTDAPVKLDSRGSFGGKDDSTEQTTKNTVSEETGDSLVTLAWQDIDNDFTTETSEYEATTDVEGHIGGPAPAVVASLLG